MLNVTPCMGVWIETRKTTRAFNLPTSHPVWVCGLKLVLDSWYIYEVEVTPCMGVWIETSSAHRYILSTTGHTLYGCVDWNRPYPDRTQQH